MSSAPTSTAAATRKFRKTLSRATTLPVLAMSAFGLILVMLVGYLLWITSWVEHADGLLIRFNDCERLMIDMETGLRGYRLTRTAEFLNPYVAARANVQQELDDAVAMASDNPEQVERLQTLRKAARDWIDYSVTTLAAVNAGSDATVEQALAGKKMMDRVRRDVGEMRSAEQDIRDRRSRTARLAAYWVVGSIVGLATLAAVLMKLAVRGSLRRVSAVYQGALDTSEQRAAEVKAALDLVDKELDVVAEIQRSLLPIEIPAITGLSLAASYTTSRQVGGDLYDFFRLPGEQERWGILIADVAGHGTPAAVLMAVTHSIAHSFAEPPAPPSSLLRFVNQRLVERYTGEKGSFVTAFYAIFNCVTRELSYSSAGHPPPRVMRGDGQFISLGDAQSMPLGIDSDEEFFERHITLDAGDTLVLYTDGITETRDTADNEEFGIARIDEVLSTHSTHETRGESCAATAGAALARLLSAVATFSGDAAAKDDRTVLVACVG